MTTTCPFADVGLWGKRYLPGMVSAQLVVCTSMASINFPDSITTLLPSYLPVANPGYTLLFQMCAYTYMLCGQSVVKHPISRKNFEQHVSMDRRSLEHLPHQPDHPACSCLMQGGCHPLGHHDFPLMWKLSEQPWALAALVWQLSQSWGCLPALVAPLAPV